MTQPKEVARNFLPFVPRGTDAETAEFLVSPLRSTYYGDALDAPNAPTQATTADAKRERLQ